MKLNRTTMLMLTTVALASLLIFSNAPLVQPQPPTNGTNPPPNTWSLIISSGSGGTVSPSGTKFLNYGQTINVYATPNNGYSFSGWKLDGSAFTSNPITVGGYNVGTSHSLTASFQIVQPSPPPPPPDGNVVFTSSFETANFADWSQADGPLTRSTTRVHHGTYSMLCDGSDYEYVYNDYPSTYQKLHLRFYIWFEGVPSGDVHIACINDFYTSETYRNDYHLMVSGGKWALFRPPWDGGYITKASTGPISNTWICVELMCSRSGSTVSAQVWINGNSILTNSYDSGRTYNFGQVHLGGWGKSSPCNFYIDCAVISTGYIGPE